MTSSAVAIGKRVENPAISRSMARGRSRARGQRGWNGGGHRFTHHLRVDASHL